MSVLWALPLGQGDRSLRGYLSRNWEVATIVTAQSGRPFSVTRPSLYSVSQPGRLTPEDYNWDSNILIGGDNLRTTQYLMATLLCVTAPVSLPAAEARATGQTLASITTLEEQARARVTVDPRISLLPPASPVFKNIGPLLQSDTGRVPNDVRAVAMLPDGPVGLAGVMKAFLFEGTVEPETKLAMALRMAQVNGSPYTAAHVVRLLRATDRGQVLLTALESGRLDSLSAADQRDRVLRCAD